MRALILAVCLTLSFAGGGVAEEAAPLRAGIFPAAPPFIIRDRAGHPDGFTIQLFRALAARLHRPIVFTAAAPADLLAGLEGGRFDVLPGPILATPEHASAMLLLEGYAWSEFQFASLPSAPIRTLADLRGKRLAAQTATDYAGWATRNAPRDGFSAVLLADQAAVFDAVRHGQADASLTGSAALRGHGVLTAGLSLPETRTQETAAVRTGETELRDELEDALRCLKQDGSVAKLATKWFGTQPAPEDLENLVMPGYGVPGLVGYDAKARKTHCE